MMWMIKDDKPSMRNTKLLSKEYSAVLQRPVTSPGLRPPSPVQEREIPSAPTGYLLLAIKSP
jgi:hypothetical protein